MTPIRRLCFAILVAAVAGCGDPNGLGEIGTFTVLLTTPANDDGAVAVRITGPGVLDVAAANSSYRIYWRLVSDTEIRALVFGAVADGPLFTVQVGDVQHADRYMGTVTQVARRDDTERDDRAGYAIAFIPAGRGPGE